jgi:hypothetical protein
MNPSIMRWDAGGVGAGVSGTTVPAGATVVMVPLVPLVPLAVAEGGIATVVDTGTVVEAAFVEVVVVAPCEVAAAAPVVVVVVVAATPVAPAGAAVVVVVVVVAGDPPVVGGDVVPGAAVDPGLVYGGVGGIGVGVGCPLATWQAAGVPVDWGYGFCPT